MFNSEMINHILQFNDADLWPEPRKKLEDTCIILGGGVEFVCEMSEEDHAFLCGMVHKMRPKKILEIGVAEGGTTAVIMECLDSLGLESEVFSVDLSERLFCDNSKRTGYVYDQIQHHIKGKSSHEFMFGKTIAGYIDIIGKDIDFVIIDTTHILPGEILDFLCILPYLSKKATVVLHDISAEYIRYFSGDSEMVLRAKESNATKLLFTTVTAAKYFVLDGQYESGYNIAAFSITDDTIKYIRDCFQILNMTWEYGVPYYVAEYREIIVRYYNEECIKLFDKAVETNKIMRNRLNLVEKELYFDSMTRYATLSDRKIQQLKGAENVIVYGAGIVAIEIIKILNKEDIKISGIAVSNEGKNGKKLCGIEVKEITKLSDYIDATVIIASTSDIFIREIEETLIKGGFQNIMKVDRLV